MVPVRVEVHTPLVTIYFGTKAPAPTLHTNQRLELCPPRLRHTAAKSPTLPVTLPPRGCRLLGLAPSATLRATPAASALAPHRLPATSVSVPRPFARRRPPSHDIGHPRATPATFARHRPPPRDADHLRTGSTRRMPSRNVACTKFQRARMRWRASAGRPTPPRRPSQQVPWQKLPFAFSENIYLQTQNP